MYKGGGRCSVLRGVGGGGEGESNLFVVIYFNILLTSPTPHSLICNSTGPSITYIHGTKCFSFLLFM